MKLSRVIVRLTSLGFASAALGIAAPAAIAQCDLALVNNVSTHMDVDYDPRDLGVDAGPGRPGQDVTLIIPIRNAGSFPIVEARLFIVVSNANCTVSGPIELTDFDDALAGDQSLAQSRTYLVRTQLPSDALSCCGTYTIEVTNDGDALRCFNGAIRVNGDGNASNDTLIDRPDADGAPDDQFSPDLLVIDPVTVSLSIPAASQTIEDPATEPLFVDATLVSSGPTPVTGTFFFDIVRAADTTNVVIANIVPPVRRRFDTINRTLRVRISLNGVGPLPQVPLKLAVRFGRQDSAATCGISLTTQSFRITPP
ncbi:MAG: hypothetical protein HY292_21425 [Planctomycetes bacterium]|nr:hypothetical protein [Planctomycetota bacterium]